MATDKQRVVILLPPDKYEEFRKMAEEKGDSMSSIGRRLILEWLAEQERKK